MEKNIMADSVKCLLKVKKQYSHDILFVKIFSDVFLKVKYGVFSAVFFKKPNCLLDIISNFSKKPIKRLYKRRSKIWLNCVKIVIGR